MRSLVVIAALVISLLLVSRAYCDDMSDSDLRVHEGNVVAVDVINSSIVVQGGIQLTFQLSPTTEFKYGSRIIELSEIDIGDYVAVEYYRQGLESRVPLKVIRVTVKYKKSDNRGFSEANIGY